METGSRAHLAGSEGGGGGNTATGRQGGSVGRAALALGRFADVTGALRPLQRPAQPLRRRCRAAQLPARQRTVGFLPWRDWTIIGSMVEAKLEPALWVVNAQY